MEKYVFPPSLSSSLPLSLSVSLSLFNKLSVENIYLPENKGNLVSELCVFPSGWKPEFLPHKRSKISKMLSEKLKY